MNSRDRAQVSAVYFEKPSWGFRCSYQPTLHTNRKHCPNLGALTLYRQPGMMAHAFNSSHKGGVGRTVVGGQQK
jgi:hypothetical protein